MQLFINGEEREIHAKTVLALIETLRLDPQDIAVEQNLEIVPKSRYGETPLQVGDRIEIVEFIGGG